MHKIIRIETNDENQFETEKEARKYLDKKYGDRLTTIVHKILKHEKYISLCEFIDANLELFQELIDLKNELKEDIKKDCDDNDFN